MDLTFGRFVAALRHAEIAVSPAETLDGFQVLEQVGIADPRLLHNALSLVFAKTIDEKQRFRDCFDRFFHQLAFEEPPKRTMLREIDADAVLASLAGHRDTDWYRTVDAVLDDHREWLTLKVQALADDAGVFAMQTLRDKSAVIEVIARQLGVEQVAAAASEHGEHAGALNYVRQYLMQQIRHYVDEQYRLVVDASGRKALLEAALKSQLDQLPREYYVEVERTVRKLADRLARQHRRRRRRAQRGTLDVKQLLRDNMAYDGAMFRLTWRSRRLDRASVFVLCDVSGSVARVARFLLLLLHELDEVLPNVRSFAFSNRLGEITDLFSRHDHSRAVEEVMLRWGNGTTDYGRALADFRELAMSDLNHRSTVIILGDARSNFFAPRTEILKTVAARVRQVFWLNPERRETWGEGDSEMLAYAPHCLRVDRCAHLADINRFADRLLESTR